MSHVDSYIFLLLCSRKKHLLSPSGPTHHKYMNFASIKVINCSPQTVWAWMHSNKSMQSMLKTISDFAEPKVRDTGTTIRSHVFVGCQSSSPWQLHRCMWDSGWLLCRKLVLWTRHWVPGTVARWSLATKRMAWNEWLSRRGRFVFF